MTGLDDPRVTEPADLIAHMRAHAQHADRAHWPALMEAAIRHGAPRDDVTAAFDATPDEQERLDALLAKPPVWRSY